MLTRIRATVPDAAITSDFIVGFCGETEKDFQETVTLVRESRFKNSFIFKYSQRPGTKAPELWPDDVLEEIKRRRNNELLAVQNSISEEDHRQFLGRTVEVLVEGPSKHAQRFDRTDDPNATAGIVDSSSLVATQEIDHIPAMPSQLIQLVGRTPCDRIVVFEGNRRQIGQILPLVIYNCTPMTLFGAVITHEVGPEVYSLSSR
jgi:tRNA-2-methylthio-N6-dimethylallyladenosine synthase